MSALPTRIAQLHLELGIDADYARKRGLSYKPDAPEHELSVVTAEWGATKPIRLLSGAAIAWIELVRAGRASGLALQLVSGFRSADQQAEIIRRKLARNLAIAEILRVVAAPGFSEHHSGCAVDVAVDGQPPLEEIFETTPAFSWLSRHAGTYGFGLSYPRNNTAGVIYEPWHWRWRSRNSLCLE